jgi:hypothetical protein
MAMSPPERKFIRHVRRMQVFVMHTPFILGRVAGDGGGSASYDVRWGINRRGDCDCVPVVSANGDGAAAQPDGDVETREVQADEGSDRGRGGAGGRHDAGAALRGVRGGDRGRGSAGRGGGSKGLK